MGFQLALFELSQLLRDTTQFVEVELDPGETVIAEAGMMMYMDCLLYTSPSPRD